MLHLSRQHADSGVQAEYDPESGHSRDLHKLCIEVRIVVAGYLLLLMLVAQDPFHLEYNVARTVTRDGLYTVCRPGRHCLLRPGR